MNEITVCILIDEDGDYAVHHDESEIGARFEEEIGTMDGSRAYRLVKLKVNVPTPRPAVVTIKVPELPDNASVTVLAADRQNPG